MKKLFPLLLSLAIHMTIVITIISLYFFVQKKIVASKTNNEKYLCISLKNYQPTQKPLMQEKKTVLKNSKTRQKKQYITKKIKKHKLKKKEKKYIRKKNLMKKNLMKKNFKETTINQKKQQNICQQQKKIAEKSKNIPKKEKDYFKKYLLKNSEIIRKLIAKNLYYPRKARKRQIQGTVKVKFMLTPSGKIKNIDILSFSPQILSNATIITLKSIEKKIPPPKKNIIITLPITYRLIK